MRASVAPVLLCVLGVGLVWQPCLAFDVEGGRPAARPGSPQQPPRTALATAQPTTVAGIEERERERREGERECVRERERARAREKEEKMMRGTREWCERDVKERCEREV